jgi:hypothetical protein
VRVDECANAGRAAELSRTACSRAALVTPVCSHVLTTGTPVTISIGNPASGMRVILSGDLAPDHEQGDVVACGLAADQGSHHLGTGCPRELWTSAGSVVSSA